MNVGARWRSGLASSGGRLLWLLGCGLLLAPHPGAPAAESPATPEPIVVPLEYRETESDLITLGLSVEQLSHPFSKEPALSGRSLRRGTFGIGDTEGFGFIWDQDQGRLYVDLNRNGDLSDDPDGRFVGTEVGGGGNFQQFDNVGLELAIKGMSHRVRVNLNLYAFGRLSGSIALRAYWSGKVILDGREWELGIVPLVQGEGTGQQNEILLLRPWTTPGTGFSVGDGSLATFACGSNLFFQGTAYDLQSKASAEAPLRLELVLTARETALGEIRFGGQHIRRAVLTDGPWTAVLEEPSGNVAVPHGTYRRHLVHVQSGDTEATLERAGWIGSVGIQQATVVQPGKPGTLATGGPLTNTVTIQRRGQSLVLNYQLIGAGGETYRPLSQNRGQPPRFAVRLGEQLIESGNFEFG